ncbi:hypothetical protein PFISCL1PPCAC_18059, partial [Pristionchus fissidentatus]
TYQRAMMKAENPPGKVSLIASRVLRSFIDSVDQENIQERRAEKGVTFQPAADAEPIGMLLPHFPPPETALNYIDQVDAVAQFSELVPSTSEVETQPRSRSSTKTSLSAFFSSSKPKRPEIPMIVLIPDSMGGVNSRERRTSSIGCWSTKSVPEDANDHYGAATGDKPSKLKLDVNGFPHRCGHELATPTSDSECNHPPLAQSSNDRLLQIIRCFPFPTPRPSPTPSPRLKRKTNGSIEDKNGARKIDTKERRSRSVDEKHHQAAAAAAA